MKTRVVAAIVAVAVVAIAVAIVVSLPIEGPDVVRIGVILPQTGFSAFIGESVRKGMDLAAEELAAQGKKPEIKLIYEDSGGDVKKAVSAYRKLVSIDKVAAVVCVSSGAQALIPLAEQDQMVLFCTAVSASDIAKQSPWCFRFFINADIDAKMIGEYAVQKRSYKRFGVLYINDEMGVSYNNVFKKTVEGLGAQVIASEGFGFQVTDFKPLLLKIKEAEPDAIYLQAYTSSMALIPVQMREVGLKAQIFSVGTISQPEVIKQAGEAVEGVVYTTCEFNTFAPATPELKAFVEAFQKKHSAPPIFFEVFGFDSFNLLAKTVQSKGATSQDIRDGLAVIKDYTGAAGKISVAQDGEVSFSVVLRQIKNGQWAPLDD